MSHAPNPDLRSPRVHRSTLDAALELAVRDGYVNVTVEAIAAAAQVGKQTIYRWWPNKAAVLLEALNDRTGPASQVPDTGDITADLTAALQGVMELLSTDLGTIWRGLIGDAQRDPRLAEDIRRTFLEPRMLYWEQRLGSAIAEGLLRADVPPRTVVELLFGPVYYRLLLETDPLDPEHAAARVDYLLNGLKA
ncbi:TetR/AcrR family transcriptional regulator [Streptomyces racemochromogenes]|uniref:TetR/AcrR family transcriptional regulator n=1 Tax=Streptomyces racemochromogenes TaxID=67353 RepID=A0ABW7PPY0_9ACTN